MNHNEPLDVFVNLRFVGLVRPLRHYGSTVLERLAGSHAIAHVAAKVGGIAERIISVCHGHGSRHSRLGCSRSEPDPDPELSELRQPGSSFTQTPSISPQICIDRLCLVNNHVLSSSILATTRRFLMALDYRMRIPSEVRAQINEVSMFSTSFQ